VETIGSKRSYALTWCMPNNDDDDDKLRVGVLGGALANPDDMI